MCCRPSFGIAFDIDGVILRGHDPIGGSPQALRRLYNDDGMCEPLFEDDLFIQSIELFLFFNYYYYYFLSLTTRDFVPSNSLQAP